MFNRAMIWIIAGCCILAHADEVQENASTAVVKAATDPTQSPAEKWQPILEKLTLESPDQQEAPWRLVDAEGLSVLGDINTLYGSDPKTDSAIRAVFDRAVHHTLRPDLAADRKQIADILLACVTSLNGGAVDQADIQHGAGIFEFLKMLSSLAQQGQTALIIHAQTREWQSQLLQWIGLTASAEHVSALAGLLKIDDLAGETAATLGKIPDDNATNALIAALDTTAGEVRLQIISTLAYRDAHEAKPKLVEMARHEDKLTSWACAHSLALMGAPPSEIGPRNPAFTPEENLRYAQDSLLAAQQLADHGDTKRAEAIFLSFSDMAGQRYEIRAALIGLAGIHSEKLQRIALGYLGTPGVREMAIQLLAADSGKSLEDKLEKTFAVSDAGMKSGILEILALRQSAVLSKLSQEGLQAKDPQVRFAAAQILNVPPDEQDLRELAETGPPWVRDKALRAYLDLAQARLIAGDRAEALAQLRDVAQGRFSEDAKREALEGIGNAGVLEDADLLRKYQYNTALAASAQRALITLLAREEEPGKATEEVATIGHQAAKDDVVAAASEALGALGADVSGMGGRRGYITDWRVTGPFPIHEGQDLDFAYLSSFRGDATDMISYDGVQFIWHAFTAGGVPAVLDFKAALGEYSQVAGYAATRVAVNKITNAQILIGSSCPYVLWVNGKKAGAQETARVLKTDQDSVGVSLRAGINKILFKAVAPAGEWKLCARFTDRSGAPLDLSQQVLPDDGLTGVGMRAGAANTGSHEATP